MALQYLSPQKTHQETYYHSSAVIVFHTVVKTNSIILNSLHYRRAYIAWALLVLFVRSASVQNTRNSTQCAFGPEELLEELSPLYCVHTAGNGNDSSS